MFKSEKKESKNYEVNVINARQTKNDSIVMVDLEVNGVKIYSCIFKEIVCKKDGDKHKKGDICYVLNLPYEKGSDGKYYARVWFPVSGKIIEAVKAQIEMKLK